MTDYYIKISNEIPVGEDEGLWFKVNGDELEDGDEFFVIRRNDYNELKESLTILEGELGDNEILTNAVNNAMEHITTVPPLSTSALRIIDDNDNSKIFTYTNINDLKTKLDTVEVGSNKIVVDNSLKNTSTNPVENRVVNNALSTKTDNSVFQSTVQTLNNNINSKSPKTHTHDTKYIKWNDHCEMMVNEAVRVCHFSYYWTDIGMTAGKTYDYNLGLGNYKPVLSVKLATLNSNQIAQLTTDGHLKFSSLQSGTQNIYFGGTYIY